MVHLVILMLGVAAYVWSDLSSHSAFFNAVLPLVVFVVILYSMVVGIYVIQRKNLGRESQHDVDMRFLAHMSAELKAASPKAPAPSAGSSPAQPGTPPAASLSDQE